MRKGTLVYVAGAVLLPIGAVASIAASPPTVTSGAAAAETRTLTFDVQFGPFSLLPLNPTRDPATGLGLGDEITFHDLLFSHGTQVGDEGGSCVIVETSQGLANCSEVMRLAGGEISAQFLNAPPPQKQLAVTGGTGVYRSVGGEGTLVEFGNGTGSLTLHLTARQGGS